MTALWALVIGLGLFAASTVGRPWSRFLVFLGAFLATLALAVYLEVVS